MSPTPLPTLPLRVIEARDLNDALQVAQKIPSVRTGSIEVRPIQEYS